MNTASVAAPRRPEPPLILDASLHPQLLSLAQRALATMPDVAERLIEEVERAELVASDQVPQDVVGIGSQVTYRDDASGGIRTIRLVMPGDADLAALRVSVLSPIGAALIGLRVGQRMSWPLRDGVERSFSVLQVVRPEV